MTDTTTTTIAAELQRLTAERDALAARLAEIERAEPATVPNGVIERVIDARGAWRMAIIMMRDYKHLLTGLDCDVEATDWERVRRNFEATLDMLAAAAAPQPPAAETAKEGGAA